MLVRDMIEFSATEGPTNSGEEPNLRGASWRLACADLRAREQTRMTKAMAKSTHPSLNMQEGFTHIQASNSRYPFDSYRLQAPE
jgi:hypothetical protein